MRKLLIFFSLLILFVSAACGMGSGFGYQTERGSGSIQRETREVPDFTQVSVCCGMELYLAQGEPAAVEIEADDNLLEKIESNVVAGMLEVKYEHMTGLVDYQPTKPVRVYITAPEIQGADISGGGYFEASQLSTDRFDLSLSGGTDAQMAGLASGDIKIQVSGGGKIETGDLVGDDFSLNLSGGSSALIDSLQGEQVSMTNSGGGNISVDALDGKSLYLDTSGGSSAAVLNLKAGSLDVNGSGGGTIKITGEVDDQDVNVSGGTSYQAGDLQNGTTDFTGSGGGTSTVWVTDRLSAGLSGGSSLHFYGDPDTDSNISGGGALKPLGDK